MAPHTGFPGLGSIWLLACLSDNHHTLRGLHRNLASAVLPEVRGPCGEGWCMPAEHEKDGW